MNNNTDYNDDDDDNVFIYFGPRGGQGGPLRILTQDRSFMKDTEETRREKN